MRAPKDGVARPTLRCLLDDLSDEVGPPQLPAALRPAARDLAHDSRYLSPLAAAEHIVLDKVNMLARDRAAERELIETITDRAAVKSRRPTAAARWR